MRAWAVGLTIMTSTLPQPVPKNLREQMLDKLKNMPEPYLVVLYEAFLHAEAVSLLDEMSRDAELEQAEGKWDSLPDLIKEVRGRIRASRRAS
jgi:hypothetical protein